MKIALIISIYNIIVNAFYYQQTGNWTSIASSSDGIKIIACNNQTDKTVVGGVFISNDAGLSWNYTIIPNGDFLDVASDYSGRNLYVVWSYQIDSYHYDWRIYSSHDFGLSWTYIDLYGTLIETDSSGKYVYLACSTMICVSEDYGATFKEIQVYSSSYSIISLACDNTGKKVFAVVDENFWLAKSINYGENWALVDTLPYNIDVLDVAVDSTGNIVILNVIETVQDFYSTKRNLIYSSNDGGISWAALSTEINNINKITLDVTGSYLSVTQALYDISNVYFSSNHGMSWVSLFQPTPTTLTPTPNPTPIPKTPTLKPTKAPTQPPKTPTLQPTKAPTQPPTIFYCAIYTNSSAVVGSSYGTLFRANSVNNQIWSTVAPGIFISSVISSRNFIYASIFKENSNILMYNLSESRWLTDNNQINGVYISSLASNYQNDIILASGFYDDYIYISYDNSKSWYVLNNSPKSDWISVDCDMNCTNILAYDNKSSLYFSKDIGQTWQQLSTPISGSVMTTFALNRYNPNHILAAGYNTGIFYSLDLGISWVDSSFAQRQWVNITLDNSGQYSLAITYSSDIYFSHNFGRTWNKPAIYPKLLDMETWTKITSDATGQFGAAIYASTNGSPTYIYYSTDYGMNWAQINYLGYWKNVFMSDSPTLIASERSSEHTSNLFYKIELGVGNNNYSISIIPYFNTSSSVVDIVGNSDLTLLITIIGKGIYYLDAKSNNWYASDTSGYTYTKLSIDHTGAYCVVAAVSSTILISKDYGRSFSPTNSSIGDWFMVSTDSTFSTIVGLQYLKKSVFYSYDLGSTWIEVTEAIDYRAFAIARLNSSIMLAAGGSSSYPYKTSPIYVSYDGGSSWQTGSPISKQWNSIATSESGELVLIAGINSSLFRSLDGGSLWMNTSSPEACSWIYVACNRLGEYAIALSLNCGVYGSTDYGNTWYIQDSITNGLWSSATFDPSGANVAYITSSSNLDSIQVVSINVPPDPSSDSSDDSNQLDTSVIIIISVVVPLGSALFILISRYLYKNDKKRLVFLYLTLSAMGDLLSDILFLISIHIRTDLETQYLRTVNDTIFYLGIAFLSFVALFNMYCIQAYGEFRYTIFQPEPDDDGFLEKQFSYLTQKINEQSRKKSDDKQGTKFFLIYKNDIITYLYLYLNKINTIIVQMITIF